MADWSQLPLDLLHQVTDQFTLHDMIRFGCVCSPWRSFSTPARHKGRLPFLMLPSENNSQETGNSWPDSLQFYSLLDSKFYKTNLPNIKDRRICGSSNGWLITIHSNSDLHLIHPLSNQIIDLPSLNDIPSVYGIHFSHENGLQYIVSDGVGGSRATATYENAVTVRDTYIVKMIVSPSFLVVGLLGEFRRLFYRTLEMQEWKMIEEHRYTMYYDITYYNGQFYAIDTIENVVVIEGLHTSLPYTRRIVTLREFDTYPNKYYRLYLVECSGKLLKVVRPVETGEVSVGVVDGKKTVEFRVFELNIEQGGCLEVKDLGDYALFLGTSQSSSVCTSGFPGCKRNCIYITDDWTEKRIGSCDNGVYDLENRTFEAIYPDAGDSQVILPRPVWYASMPGHC